MGGLRSPTLCPLPLAAGSALPGRSGGGGTVLSLLGMLLTVAAVLALAYWCTRWIAQRGAPGWTRGGTGKAQVLWQLSLGKNERLVLVQFERRCLLLGVTGGGISLLKELTEEEAAGWLQKPEEAARQPSFLEILRENLPKKK